MTPQHDKAKRWQFGLRESTYFTTLLCAVFATVPLGFGLVLLFAPLYVVMFLAIIGKADSAVLVLVFWIPLGGLVACSSVLERIASSAF